MTTAAPFLEAPIPVDRAIQAARRCLQAAGLQAVITFDLRAARQAHPAALCPLHQSATCSCQLVVLLIYSEANDPLALLVQGSGSMARFSLPATAGERIVQQVQELISQAAGHGGVSSNLGRNIRR